MTINQHFQPVKEVCPSRFPVHPVTFIGWVRDGNIPREFAPKIGRKVLVDVDGLMAWLRADGRRQAAEER